MLFSVNSAWIEADVIEEALIKYIHLFVDDEENVFEFHPITIRQNNIVIWFINDPECLKQELDQLAFYVDIHIPKAA